MEIVTIAAKKDEKFLRNKTVPFDFSKYGKKEINTLIAEMRRSMKDADGIGLSANQIGLNIRVFVAQVQDKDGSMKFYSVFNPQLDSSSKDTVPYEEGCLSVPGLFGSVERPEKISITCQDKSGKKIKMKAWGLLARVFQHEIDHLDGKLFIDRTKQTYKIEKNKK